MSVPFRSRIQLHSHHLDAVPRSYTDATEQTLQGDDGRLAEAQEQEEAATC